MTNTPDTCPAAQIGKRIAELRKLTDELERREARAKKAGEHREASICKRKLDNAYDELETSIIRLSHVRSESPDGAAVQVAAAVALVDRVLDYERDSFKEGECQRAIDRLLYSAIRRLQDRVEADCHEYGVEHLASSTHDPWNGVDNVLNAYQEMEDEHQRKSAA